MLWNQQAKGLRDVMYLPPGPPGIGAYQGASEPPAQVTRLTSCETAGGSALPVLEDGERVHASEAA